RRPLGPLLAQADAIQATNRWQNGASVGTRELERVSAVAGLSSCLKLQRMLLGLAKPFNVACGSVRPPDSSVTRPANYRTIVLTRASLEIVGRSTVVA